MARRGALLLDLLLEGALLHHGLDGAQSMVLLLEECPTRHGADLLEVLVVAGKGGEGEGGVAVHQRLQHRVVDEHVLLLWTEGGRAGTEGGREGGRERMSE